MHRYDMMIRSRVGFDQIREIGAVQVYAYELTIGTKGTLTLKDLPFSVGEEIEVIIIPRSRRLVSEERYPFWGKPIMYLNPTDPVAEADWGVLTVDDKIRRYSHVKLVK